ncbi:non-specific serine/threonine protein kinase [Ranunculus cassubicifolius]
MESSIVPEIVEEKIYVAVGKDVSDCKSCLLWASKNFGGAKICIVHVHQPAQMIPFMGAKFPANKLGEQEVRAYRNVELEKMHKMLNEYLFMCTQLGVQAEKLYIEWENVENGIVELIARHGIKRLIMGATAGKNKKITTIKSKKAIFLSQRAHISCHIWFVSKGCLIQTREGILDQSEIQNCDSPRTSSSTESSPVGHRIHKILASPVQKFIRGVRSHGSSVASVPSLDETGGTLMPQNGTKGTVNDLEENSRGETSQVSGFSFSSSEEVVDSLDSLSFVRDEGSENGSLLSSVQESEEDLLRSSPTNQLENDGRMDPVMFGSLQQAMVELENAKREAREESFRRRKAEMNASEAIHKAKESEKLYADVVKQKKELEIILERDSSELNRTKKELDEVIEDLKTALDQKMALENQIADYDRTLKEFEEKIDVAVKLLLSFRQERDKLQVERDNAVHETQLLRRRRAVEATSSQGLQFFSDFSFSEIDAATSSFDPSLIIGDGGDGTVYKGYLRNTDVAIKSLNPSSLQGRSEFQQEVEVLSKTRHPNLVTLIGTCSEAWSLVYEYLPNGNLQDRLSCKDNSSPLSWATRIRIAVDICSALIFLHSNKPHGILHGDLKPTNILLDANFVSKLGDFGISRSLDSDDKPKEYMDPEFVMTGELTPKSDVYSFGMILLQLLTGRAPFGIAKEVQQGLDGESLGTMLDPSAGDWPFVQLKQLAHLALRCCALKSENRPDLASEVWRVLEPMKASCGGSSSSNLGTEEPSHVPSYFICPIFQDIMQEPRVAADGFTYELEAIKGWIDGGHNTSPMTNLKLSHNDLVPNHSLRSAIEEWRQKH